MDTTFRAEEDPDVPGRHGLVETGRLRADRPVTTEGEPVPGLTVGDFWEWSSSNLLDNTLRGLLAEYLVGAALGVTAGRTRREWDTFDHLVDGELSVEVKSTAYLQSWAQSRPSTLAFRIRETSAWDAGAGLYATEHRRHAAVYVFCVFAARTVAAANLLDTAQWEFHVVATTVLDRFLRGQKTVTLSRLLGLPDVRTCRFDELGTTVRDVAGT